MATTPLTKPLVCPTILGRDSYIAALRGLIGQLRGRRGHVGLISGEAGIGKTRLIGEARTFTQSLGYSWLQGNCFQSDRTYPYAPFLDLLRSACATQPITPARLATEPYLRVLTQLLPELAPDEPAGAQQSAPATQPDKRQLTSAILQFVAHYASATPVVLVLEDIHWCDDAGLDLLLSLARRSAEQPLLALLTYRSDEVSASLRHILAQIDRERLGQELSLVRLPVPAVSDMLQAICPMRPALHAQLLQAIFAFTDGNPFFVEEVLKALVVSGDLVSHEGRWERQATTGAAEPALVIPRTVNDAVQQRAERLTPETRRALTLAAVAGRRFDFAVLQRLLECDEHHLLGCIKELIGAQLVIEESADRFAFRHALTRAAVYSDLLVRERHALHRAIANTIEHISEEASAPEVYVADLAYHYFEAEDWENATRFGQLAGARALAFHAPRAAIESFNRVVLAISRSGAQAPPTLFRSRGAAYLTLGEFELARLDFTRALDAARTAENRPLEWQCLLDLGFLWAGRDYAAAGEWFQHALELAQQLDDPLLRAHSLNRLGNWLVNIGNPADGVGAHEEALALFKGLPDALGVAQTHDLLGMATGIFGDTITSLRYYSLAIDGLRAQGDRDGLISALASRVAYGSPALAETTFSSRMTFEDCVRDITEAQGIAHDIDSLAAQAYTGMQAGFTAGVFGEFGRALREGQRALQIATEIEHQQWMAASQYALGRLYYLQLDATRAITHLSEGLTLARAVGSAWWIGNCAAHLALAHLQNGDTTAARDVLHGAMAIEHEPRTAPERRMLWAWGELALAQGQSDDALEIVRRLLTTVPGAATDQPIPWLLRLRGEAHLARKEYTAAIEALTLARQGARDRGERPLLWQVEMALGRASTQARQGDRSQRAFAAARLVVEELARSIQDEGMRAAFVRAALATAPKALASVKRSQLGGLTEREAAVARLIAQGQSNRAIAEELVISERTVESHVSHVLEKLGLASRTQIATWVIEAGQRA